MMIVWFAKNVLFEIAIFNIIEIIFSGIFNGPVCNETNLMKIMSNEDIEV